MYFAQIFIPPPVLNVHSLIGLLFMSISDSTGGLIEVVVLHDGWDR